MINKPEILSDEQIRITKAEAVRLSWTHKAHPSYEKDKYLLEAQRDKDYKEMIEQFIKLVSDIILPSVSDFYQSPKDIDSYVYGYNDGQDKTLEAIEEVLQSQLEKEVR